MNSADMVEEYKRVTGFDCGHAIADLETVFKRADAYAKRRVGSDQEYHTQFYRRFRDSGKPAREWVKMAAVQYYGDLAEAKDDYLRRSVGWVFAKADMRAQQAARSASIIEQTRRMRLSPPRRLPMPWGKMVTV